MRHLLCFELAWADSPLLHESFVLNGFTQQPCGSMRSGLFIHAALSLHRRVLRGKLEDFKTPRLSTCVDETCRFSCQQPNIVGVVGEFQTSTRRLTVRDFANHIRHFRLVIQTFIATSMSFCVVLICVSFGCHALVGHKLGDHKNPIGVDRAPPWRGVRKFRTVRGYTAGHVKSFT